MTRIHDIRARQSREASVRSPVTARWIDSL